MTKQIEIKSFARFLFDKNLITCWGRCRINLLEHRLGISLDVMGIVAELRRKA